MQHSWYISGTHRWNRHYTWADEALESGALRSPEGRDIQVWNNLEIQSKSIYRIRDHDKNLGWPEKADRFKVLHIVSVLWVNALKKEDLLLQDLRLSVDHTHYTGL